MHCDAQVRRQGPRRGGPDQHEYFASCEGRINLCRIACQRKLYINRRARVLVVLDFRFSERRLIVNAPVDGPRALVNETALNKAREQPGGLGFVMVGHRDVGIVPLAQDSEPLKIFRLSLQSIGREFTACASNAQRRHFGLLLTEFSFNVQLDRQSVTVISRNVWRVITHHRARLDDKVFQNFIERSSQVNVGVCVRRAIVQDELPGAGARFANLFVELHLRPLFQTRGLVLRQVCLLREPSLRQINCLLQFEWRCFSRHSQLFIKSEIVTG